VIAVAMLFQAWTIGTIQYAFTFWIDPWMIEFDATRTELILPILVAQIGTTLLAPIAGHAMDHWPLGRLCAMGLVAFSIGLLGTILADAPWQIVLCYGPLMAVAMALTGPLMGQTLATKWFREGRGMAMGWVTTGTSLGGLLVPPMIAWLILHHGWRVASAVPAAGALVVLLPVVLFVLRTPPPNSPPPSAAPDEVNEEAPGESGDEGAKLTTLEIVRQRAFWVTALGFIPGWGLISAVQINFGPYTSDLGVEPQRAAFFVSLISGSMIAGKLAFGALADRLDFRVTFSIVVGMLGLALLAMAASPSPELLIPVCIAIGLGGGGLLPLSGLILAGHFGDALFGRVMGLFYLAFAAASITAPLAGAIRDRFGSYDPFWLAMATVLVVAGLPLLLLRPTDAKDAQDSERRRGDPD
jgi:MFS family permease